MTKLFDGAIANGSSTPMLNWFGKVANVAVSGVWNGATVTFELSPDGGVTWLPVGSSSTFTANGTTEVRIARGAGVRATLSGVGATTNLNAWVW